VAVVLEVLVEAAAPVVSVEADAAAPQASGDIAVAFALSVSASVAVAEVDTPVCPSSLAFPNDDYFANPASADEVVGWESVHSSTYAHTNYVLCSVLSNPGLHQNRMLEHVYKNASHGHDAVSDTNDHPIDATRTHSKNTNLRLSQVQHKHRLYRAVRSHREALDIRWAEAEEWVLRVFRAQRDFPTPVACMSDLLLLPVPVPGLPLELVPVPELLLAPVPVSYSQSM
jgi:hypothetical protein